MTKEQLQGLARLGVRQQLLTIERVLGGIFREFPEEFASDTAPVLLRPELKAGGNDWPAFVATPIVAAVAETNGNGNGHVKNQNIANAWTPERRAAQSRRMKARARKLGHVAGTPIRKGARVRPPRTKKAAMPWGTFTWQRLHDFLATQEGHRAHTADIMKAIDAKTSPTLISAVKIHPELFKSYGAGDYGLKKVLTADQKTGD